MVKNNLSTVVDYYIQACFMEEGIDTDVVIDPLFYEQAYKDCESFVGISDDLLVGIDPELVGHDFYLTRNNTDLGFYKRLLDPEVRRQLTHISKFFGPTKIGYSDSGVRFV